MARRVTSAVDEFLLTETSDELSRTPTVPTRARSLLHRDKVYIRNKDGSEELYDQSTDPAESTNLASSTEAAPWLGLFRDKMREIDEDAVSAEERIAHKNRSGTRGRRTVVTGAGPVDLAVSVGHL